MKRSLHGLSGFLTGAAIVALGLLAPNCQPSGGEQIGGGDGGSAGNGEGGSGEGGDNSGGSSAKGGSGGSNSGGTTSSGGSNEGGSSAKGGSNAGGSSAKGGSNAGGSSAKGGSNAGGSPKGGSGSGGTSSNGGATTSNGGTSGSGGSTGAATCTTDLMTLRSGTDANWVASTDKACSVQGAVYAYGDGSTCTSPSPISSTACVEGDTGCCIKGTTVVDTTYAKYGCGLGMDLNSSGGTSATKSAYTGAAKGFKITLSGSVAKGQPIRIMYSSAATDPSGGTSPYKEVTDVGTYSVLFSDVECPEWATAAQCTPVSGSAAYSLKVQLAGGGASTDPVGPFEVCITSIVPIL